MIVGSPMPDEWSEFPTSWTTAMAAR